MHAETGKIVEITDEELKREILRRLADKDPLTEAAQAALEEKVVREMAALKAKEDDPSKMEAIPAKYAATFKRRGPDMANEEQRRSAAKAARRRQRKDAKKAKRRNRR